jgi:hypothetical protein
MASPSRRMATVLREALSDKTREVPFREKVQRDLEQWLAVKRPAVPIRVWGIATAIGIGAGLLAMVISSCDYGTGPPPPEYLTSGWYRGVCLIGAILIAKGVVWLGRSGFRERAHETARLEALHEIQRVAYRETLDAFAKYAQLNLTSPKLHIASDERVIAYSHDGVLLVNILNDELLSIRGAVCTKVEMSQVAVVEGASVENPDTNAARLTLAGAAFGAVLAGSAGAIVGSQVGLAAGIPVTMTKVWTTVRYTVDLYTKDPSFAHLNFEFGEVELEAKRCYGMLQLLCGNSRAPDAE